MRRIRGPISAAIFLVFLVTAPAGAGTPGHYDYPGCRPYPTGPDSPTGVVGCVVDGTGQASWYHGSAVARNDCVYPWTRCAPITITALDTGRSVTIVPAQYCDCYLGDGDSSNDRMVDLTPQVVLALGLDPAQGLFRVRVEPASGPKPTFSLPNTATRGSTSTR